MSELLTKIGKTVDYHTRRARRGLRGLAWGVTRPLADRPIMVLGCSRAGTTLVYKTLSESNEIGSLQRLGLFLRCIVRFRIGICGDSLLLTSR